MEKYISAEKLLEVSETDSWARDYEPFEEDIEFTAIANVQEVKHGKWVRDEFGSKCSCCGLYAYRDKFEKPWESNYCPNCGAKMDFEEVITNGRYKE